MVKDNYLQTRARIKRNEMIKKIIAKLFIYLILIIMYAPILLLIVFSFTNTKALVWDGFDTNFTLYKELFKDEEVLDALKNTIFIALASGICSTILGTIGAIGIFYCKNKTKNIIKMLNQIPVINAEIVTAISLTLLFVILGVEFNFLTLLIGHVVLTVPFVVLSVLPKLQQMDPNVYEAALDLGATPGQALYKVIIPRIIPGVLSGLLLSITLSLDDYIITAFTRNNSFNTLSTYIYGVTAKSVLPPTLRALTTIITLVVILAVILVNIYNNKHKENN